MKRKILDIIIITILIVMVLILTGCGNEKTSDEVKQEGGKTNSQTNISNKENMEKISISELYATSENYAVVEGKDGKIYIINQEGIAQCTIDDKVVTTAKTAVINNDGYAIINEGTLATVFDKNGNKVLESDSTHTTYYSGITPDGYLLSRTSISDFNGNSVITEVVNLKGETVYKLDNYYVNPVYVGGNLFILDNSTLYNAKTNKMNKIDQAISSTAMSYYTQNQRGEHTFNRNYTMINDNMAIYDSGNSSFDQAFVIKEDLSVYKFDAFRVSAINEKYCLNKENNSICDYNGNVIKELTEGNGASSIYYDGSKYHVLSGTGYYYTLDNELNKISEPALYGQSVSLGFISKYGICKLKDTANRESALYNFDGTIKKDFDKYYVYDPENFIADAYIYGKSNLSTPVNLVTGELVQIYK